MNWPTWSDLNSPAIVPPSGAGQPPDLGPVAILVSTRPDLAMLTSMLEQPETQPFFMGSLIKEAAQGISLAGPYIGAPYGVMLLESLMARGARTILVLGWCGSVVPDLGVGDLLVPDRALVDEGTSGHYCRLSGRVPATRPHPDLFSALVSHGAAAQAQGICQGAVWTTDAIFRETAAKVARFRSQGAVAVEMECSALFAAARFQGAALAALLVVSDMVATDRWTPGFGKKAFKQARKRAAASILALAREQHGQHR